MSIIRTAVTTAMVAGAVGIGCATAPAPEATARAHAEAAADLMLEKARLEGRIDPQDAVAISDLDVNVFRAGDDGTLISLAKKKVKTDEKGRYHIDLTVPKSAMVNIVIVADHPKTGGRGMAVVPSWSMVDGVIIAPTIDLESAVESDIYLEASKQGLWVSNLGTNELRSMVSGRLAHGLRGSDNYNRDVAVMAQATVAAIEAWYRTLLDPSNGLAPTQVEAIFEAMAWAQVALDAQLYAAETPEDVKEARAIHAIAISAAYASVGIQPEHLAIAGQASADTLRRFAHAMTPNMRSMLISEAEAMRARYVIVAVDSLLSKAGTATSDRNEVKGAGSRLAGKLVLAAESEDPDEHVRRAWKEYQEVIGSRLDAIAGREGREDRKEDRDETARSDYAKEKVI